MVRRARALQGATIRTTLLLVLFQQCDQVVSFDTFHDHSTVFATYRSQWSNRSSLLSSFPSTTCQRHSDCDQFEFCFGKVGFGDGGAGVCQNFFSETCTEEFPCEVGDGDCDSDFDCVSDLVCGTDNCPFIGTNRVPSSADCCVRPPPLGWAFGTTQVVAEMDLDHVATVLETAIANGNFTALCAKKGFGHIEVIATFLTESLVGGRFFVDGVVHLVGDFAPADFSTFIAPHRDYRYLFSEAVAELLSLRSRTQVAVDGIFNDSTTVTDTGDAAFHKYRRLGDSHTVKVYFRVDLGTVRAFFEEQFEVAPRSARSSVSYLQFLQSSERNTGKACGSGYMGHDCTERVCAYGVSIYSSMFVDLDRQRVPGFQFLNGPEFTGAEHTYAECSDAGACNRRTGECECYSPFNGRACRRVDCPQGCNGHGRCVPSSFTDGRRPSPTDAFAFGTQRWDRYKRHICVCDRAWEGTACSQKICPRGDFAVTLLPDFEEELSGCDAQEVAFANISAGDNFVLTFSNFENDQKKTYPIEFDHNSTRLAFAIKAALEDLPNELIPSVTTFAGNDTDDVATVHVVFTDTHNSGFQRLLGCSTVSPASFCPAGAQPLMLPTEGTCSVRHLQPARQLNENMECGGRGHCDRQLGVCNCNIGTYGEACEMTTDYL